jgi:glycosyltransferase involved in cell wall biosynthesis
MAVYNGARFLGEQLTSILTQLDEEDELVVVDDCSADQSVSVIKSFQDARIKLLLNETNRGVLKTFETALLNASHDLLFLCDQDDVWRADKVQKFKDLFALDSGLSLAASDARTIDAEGQITAESFFATRPFHSSLLLNLLRNRYLGCTMVFRRDLLGYCLPFPADIPMHDMWIGMVNQLVGRSTFIPEPLVSYRRHSHNATDLRHASVARMIGWRFSLIKNLARFYLRFIFQGRPLIIPSP